MQGMHQKIIPHNPINGQAEDEPREADPKEKPEVVGI
jgi:hypothetical protein